CVLSRVAGILQSLVEIALAVPLIGAVAVDKREIALVEPAGLQEPRAGLDGRVTGSPYARLAVIRCCRNDERGGRHADQPDESPFLNVFCEHYQTPPLFGQGR